MQKYFLFLALICSCTAAPLPLTPGQSGFPEGWFRYGGGPGTAEVRNGILHLADRSDLNEFGIYKVFKDPAPGKYEITLEARGDLTRSQMVVIPDGQRLVSSNMTGKTGREYRKFYIGYEVPAGCKKVTFYIFGFYREKPEFQIRKIDLAQVKEFSSGWQKTLQIQNPAPPRPLTRLKDLHLTTPLARALIAPGNTPELQKSARQLAARFGGKIVSPENVRLPLAHHVIALGNRENNALIQALYLRGFCYTDQIYPGEGGHELRSIHNPTGGGYNVILCGGSDDAGAIKAAKLLAAQKSEAGFLQDVHFPAFRKNFDPCDPDHYYQVRAGGYYGWNLISGMMALFYQTGDTRYAAEFLRLAFPDAQARKDLQKYNPESFDLLNDPLAGPYHYLGHQMILLWDLIEEHPFFSDEVRLKVTNAFARQWKHHIRDTRKVGRHMIVTSRHGQWGQICNYTLARYFNRDYPDPAWTESLRRAEAEFSLANYKQGWILGEGGILSWFISGSINPAIQFAALAGETEFEPNGALANALKFMETQWDGSPRSEIFNTAGKQTFHMISEHTGDGKYLWYADLINQRQKVPFKLGASFAPTGRIAKRPPTELLQNWTLAPMKLGEHRFYGLQAPLKNCYLGASWRDTLDVTGDWVSFNCFNEKYRTPFKLLSLYGLRLNGHWLLSGFGNYVQPVRGGITDKAIPTVGQVYGSGKAGNSVFFSGGVPDHAFSAWRRDLLLRRRTFVLLADTITPVEKSQQDITAMIHLQTPGTILCAPERKNQILFTSTQTAHAIPVKEMQCSGKPECVITSGPRMVVFRTQKIGDRAVITFRLPQERTCSPVLQLFDHNTRAGAVNVYLDGKRIHENIPHFVPQAQMSGRTVAFPATTLAAGEHTIELEVAGVANQAASNWIAAGTLTIPQAQSGPARVMTMTANSGAVTIRGWNEAVVKRRMASDPAKPVSTFSLFSGSDPRDPVTAHTINDQAALFLRPEPLLAFCGHYSPIGTADLAALEPDRIAGSGIRSLTGCLQADRPVSLDWVYGKDLHLSGQPGTGCIINGKKFILNDSGTLLLQGCTPANLPAWQKLLREKASRFSRQKQDAGRRPVPEEIRGTRVTALPAGLSFIRPAKNGYLAGCGQQLLILNKQLQIQQRIPFAAPVISGVEAGDLYIAGTRAEEIAAIDHQGKKRWTFTSRIAPEVFATHKYYWFKSVYPGVLSLEYRDGRIYAGGACTMEVLDLQGKLLGRYPQTWGPCRKITFIAREDASYDAVGIRYDSSDGVHLWRVNSKTGRNTRSFSGNMPGFVHFPSFGSLYRTQAFAADFDGDGQEELLTDAQGMYSWLNLYNAAGQPEQQANLGPGKTIRTWTVGDVTGDARPEAVIADLSNQLITLDGTCRPLWTADMPIAGEHIAIDPVNRKIVVAGKDMVCCLDGNGRKKYFIRLPDPVEHLWSGNGAVYAATAREIHRLP